MRRFVVLALAAVALSACSPPSPEALDCTDGQSVYMCKARFSDGKSRSIVFVKVVVPGQKVLDEVTVSDDFASPYCVTLFGNATASFSAGNCGEIPPAVIDSSATTLDPNALPQGVACTTGTPVYDCKAIYSDGSIRQVTFVWEPSATATRIDSDPHTDDSGYEFCVSLYTDETATVRLGLENCP
jgi:hypothetical protein